MNATLDAQGVKGYTTPRPFGGFQIPISLQSAAIRRYCEEHSLLFHHHSSENLTGDNYAVLRAIVRDAATSRGIVMCSVSMLPQSSIIRRSVTDEAIARGRSLHFIFEGLTVDREAQVAIVEELLALTRLTAMTSARLDHLRDLERCV